MIKRLIAFIVLLGSCFGQSMVLYPGGATSPTRMIELFSGPENPSGPDYSHFINVLSTPGNNSFFNSVVHTVFLSCVGICNTGNQQTYVDHVNISGGLGGGSCPNFQWTGPNSVTASLTTVAGFGFFNSMILSHASYAGNTTTEIFAFSQNWADNLDTDCATMNPALTWAPLHAYLPGDYLCVGGVAPSCTGGSYWVMTKKTCTNADSHDNRCVSQAGSPPACLGVTSPCNDGSGGNQAQWTNNGAHAPLLDAWCDSNTTLAAQFNCYKLTLTGTAQIVAVSGVNTATVTVVNPPTYPNGQTAQISTATVSGTVTTSGNTFTYSSGSQFATTWTGSIKINGTTYTIASMTSTTKGTTTTTIGTNTSPVPYSFSNLPFNCNNATVTGTTPTTVSYTCSPALSLYASTSLSAGQITGAHALNASNPNLPAGAAGLVILSNQLPIPYELPMRVLTKYFFAQTALQFPLVSATPIAKVRVGCTKQGECDTSFGGPTVPWWSANQYNSYENELYTFMGQNGCDTVFACVANVNATNPAVEAAYALANNIGVGNNAMGTNHAYTLDCYSSPSAATGCGTTYNGGLPLAGKLFHGGDWATAFSTNNVAMGHGRKPVLQLQTTQDSTPGSSPGTCATGTCANGGCTTAGFTGSMAQDPTCTTTTFPAPNGYPGVWNLSQQYLGNDLETYACDIYLALDNTYTSTTHCPTLYSQAIYAPVYKAEMLAYLGTGTSAPVFTSAASANFVFNTTNTFNVSVTGVPIPTLTETGSLPTGVTFVDNGNGTACLCGTPTATGIFPLTLNAVNSAGTTHQSFTLTVINESTWGSGSGSGQFIIRFSNGTIPPGFPTLPQTWVNAYELDGATTNTITFPAAGTGGSWTCGVTNYGPYTADSLSSLQTAVNNMEACRTATGASVTLLLPAGGIYSGATGLIIPQTSTVPATAPLVIKSISDLPDHTTVCSHGIQDNLSTSPDIGLENPDCKGDNLSYQLGTSVTQLTSPPTYQTFANQDDVTLPGTWAFCGIACAGGTGTATSITQTNGVVSPSLDGASMQVSFSGPALSPGQTTNVLWFDKVGANNALGYFVGTWRVNVTSVTNVAALEFDQFQFNAGQRYMFGSECDKGGNWRLWNQLTSSWVSTSVSCTLLSSSAVWHKVQWITHRVPGDTSCAGGNPCMYYDALIVDGVVFTGFTPQPSAPSADPDNVGFQFQIDMSNAGGSVTANYDELNLQVSNPFYSGFTLANGLVTNSNSYNDVLSMYTLEATAANPVVRFCSPIGTNPTSNPPLCGATVIAPDHWLMLDGEARPSVGNTNSLFVVSAGATGNETQISQLPAHVHMRKWFIHGDWANLSVGTNAIATGLQYACTYCSYTDGQISQALRPGAEGHSITNAGGWGSQLKIAHSWLEGSSIGFFCGGSATTFPFSYNGCQDVQVSRNRFTFPYSWLGVLNIPNTNPVWGVSTNSIGRKNSFELKQGNRVIVVGNYFENVDASGGQSGITVGLDVRPGSSGNQTGNYFVALNNLLFRGNIGRNGCEAATIAFRSGYPANGGGVAFGATTWLMQNNLFYAVSNTNFGGSGAGAGCAGANATGLGFTNGALNWQATITENAAGNQATATLVCSSLLVAGSGTVTTNGTTTVTYASGSHFTTDGTWPGQTIFIGGLPYVVASVTNSTTLVTTTTVPTQTGAAYSLSNCPSGPPPLGLAQSDFQPGVDLISVYGCTNTNFNTATNPLFAVPSTARGTVVTTGTITTGLTIVYPWTAPALSSDTSLTCTVSNVQGYPNTFNFLHNTLITDPNSKSLAMGALSGGAWFAQNALIRDNILLGSGIQSSTTEGTKTEQFTLDTATNATIDHLVLPTRTATNYTEWGNNLNYPDPAGCTGAAGCHPPSTMYFPATSYCTGAVPDATCIGFTGAMSAGSMPLVLPDYHQFGLLTGSSFKSGGSTPASDGGDMGASLPTIDSDQTTTTFVCPYACGAPGPYQD